jgi:hypothetical protein
MIVTASAAKQGLAIHTPFVSAWTMKSMLRFEHEDAFLFF